MKGLWIRTAILAAVGFMTGLLVGLGFLAITGIREYYTQVGLGRFALYMLLSGALGAVNMGATTIYSLEEWGLLRCTLTHFLIAMTRVCFQKHKPRKKMRKYAVSQIKPKGKQGGNVEYNP